MSQKFSSTIQIYSLTAHQELVLYLLQLVQALKFEKLQNGEPNPDSSLAQFLVTRATENEALGTLLHWYLMVECDDTIYKHFFAKIEYNFMTMLVKVSSIFAYLRGITLTDS